MLSGQHPNQFSVFMHFFAKDHHLANDGSLWLHMRMSDLRKLEAKLIGNISPHVKERFYKFQLLFACYTLGLSPQEAYKLDAVSTYDFHLQNKDIQEADFFAAYKVIKRWQAKSQKIANQSALQSVDPFPAYSTGEISSLYESLWAEQQLIVNTFKKIYEEMCLQEQYKPKLFQPLLDKMTNMRYVREHDLHILVNESFNFKNANIKRIACEALRRTHKQCNDGKKDLSLQDQLEQLDLDIEEKIQRFKEFINHAELYAPGVELWHLPMLWVRTLRSSNTSGYHSSEETINDKEIQRIELAFACYVLEIDPSELYQFKRVDVDFVKHHKKYKNANEFEMACEAIERWQEQWTQYSESAAKSRVSLFNRPALQPPLSQREIVELHATLLAQQKNILHAFRVIYTSLCATNHRELAKDLIGHLQAERIDNLWDIIINLPEEVQSDAAKALALAQKHSGNYDPESNAELFTQMLVHIFDVDRNPFKRTKVVPGKIFYDGEALRHEFLGCSIDPKIIKERLNDHTTRGGRLLMHAKVVLEQIKAEQQKEPRVSLSVR